ncbi:MAG: hypothetical protein ACI8SR_000947 [Oceanicoccus sp.]
MNITKLNQYAEILQSGDEAFMLRLQLIMACGVLFAAGLTWQLATDAQLASQNKAKATIESPIVHTLSDLSDS